MEGVNRGYERKKEREEEPHFGVKEQVRCQAAECCRVIWPGGRCQAVAPLPPHSCLATIMRPSLCQIYQQGCDHSKPQYQHGNITAVHARYIIQAQCSTRIRQNQARTALSQFIAPISCRTYHGIRTSTNSLLTTYILSTIHIQIYRCGVLPCRTRTHRTKKERYV